MPKPITRPSPVAREKAKARKTVYRKEAKVGAVKRYRTASEKRSASPKQTDWTRTPLSTVSQTVERSNLPVIAGNDPENALLAEIEKKGTDVAVLSKEYGLKREDLVRLTGFSMRALADWAAGKLPSQPAQRRLHEVRRLLDALAEVVHSESIPKWLHHKNTAFDGMTPLQVIEVGEMDRLWAMVYDLGAGEPG